MTTPAVDQIAADAFRALQAKARIDHGGNTQPVLVVYAVESFPRRLSISEHADRMVLKGGRRPRDHQNRCHARRRRVPGRPLQAGRHPGQGADPFTLDFSFGDPDESTSIEMESVIDLAPVILRAYPLALNLAEKIVTAMQRRETSTRDRDFADLWVTSRLHSLSAPELRGHIRTVAAHRGQSILPMAVSLANMPDRQASYAAMVDRMSYLSPPPERWTEVIEGVIDFVDPLLADEDGRFTQWYPQTLKWE